jgi:nicotinamidase-related amidase
MISSTAPWEALRLKPSSPAVEAKIVASKKDADQETDLIFTQDTHDEAYSETQEGRKLPIPHCLKDTRGWRICKQLLPVHHVGHHPGKAILWLSGPGR